MPVEQYAGDASFRPQTTSPTMVGYYGGGGGPDPMAEALKEYQQVMGPKQGVRPFENYLGAVDSPESYRTAMMQYVANGGKRPQWYTGNYDMDKGNIDVALSSTMTPQQQEVRAEAQERMAMTKESRDANRALREQTQMSKDREHAMKREDKDKALALRTIPNPAQLKSATDTLESRLGIPLFDAMPAEQRTAVSRQVAARAKQRLATEGTAADYNSLVEEEMDKAVASGELKMGKEGSWFFNRGSQAPSFKSNGQAEESKAAISGTTNAKGWMLHVDAKGRRAYVSPDGKQFEVAK